MIKDCLEDCLSIFGRQATVREQLFYRGVKQF